MPLKHLLRDQAFQNVLGLAGFGVVIAGIGASDQSNHPSLASICYVAAVILLVVALVGLGLLLGEHVRVSWTRFNFYRRARLRWPLAFVKEIGEPASAPEQKVIGWVQDVLLKELPSAALKITRYQWRHNRIGENSPYIEVCIWFRYAGFFPVEIGSETYGRIGYQGQDFNFPPEALSREPLGGRLEGVRDAPLRLRRGDEGTLLIRQRLLDSEADALRRALEPGHEVELTTNGLSVSVSTRSPFDDLVVADVVSLPQWCSNKNPHERPGGF